MPSDDGDYVWFDNARVVGTLLSLQVEVDGAACRFPSFFSTRTARYAGQGT